MCYIIKIVNERGLERHIGEDMESFALFWRSMTWLPSKESWSPLLQVLCLSLVIRLRLSECVHY